jgi:hypothetical protein
LVFGPGVVLGGGGFAMTRNVELRGSEAGSGFELGMGYGGVLLRYLRPLLPRMTGETGLLVGAGHAEVRDLLAGREVGSDNFVVLEPEACLSIRLFWKAFLGASVGYRLPLGVEDLPGVSAADLESVTSSVFLRLGGG